MSYRVSYEDTLNTLRKFNQEQLLFFYNELNDREKANLLKELNSINYEELMSPENTIKKRNIENLKISPIEADHWSKLSVFSKNKYFDKGWEILKEKKVAVVLLAGGQGTRLSHKGPKGTYNIGIPNINSLFEMQAKWLRFMKFKLGFYVPWYIMTSPENHNDTLAFFKENNYFDYESIHFFKQKEIPALNSKRKILLKNKKEILFVPNGNGGVFKSLFEEGLLVNMKKKGIEWVFLNNIDNALVKVADPKFLGYAAIKNQAISSKSIFRNDPDEKVGMLCKVDNKPFVIEYFDLDDKTKYAKNGNNVLLFNNANIGIHIFNIDFLLDNSLRNLPYHIANKNFKTIDSHGNPIVVQNGIKLESFLFDIFPFADGMSVLQVNREEEFAPIKNKVGKNSPIEAKEMYLNYLKLQNYEYDLSLRNIIEQN